jgi:hypothetical protein
MVRSSTPLTSARTLPVSLRQQHVLAISRNVDDLVGTGAVKSEFGHGFILDEFDGAHM